MDLHMFQIIPVYWTLDWTVVSDVSHVQFEFDLKVGQKCRDWGTWKPETYIFRATRQGIIDDPYAEYFYLGSSVVWLMGHSACIWLSDMMVPGAHEMLIARTPSFWEEILFNISHRINEIGIYLEPKWPLFWLKFGPCFGGGVT